VASERRPHRLEVLFPEAGAALDVGEKKRDGAGWHRGTIHGFAFPSGSMLIRRTEISSARDQGLRKTRVPVNRPAQAAVGVVEEAGPAGPRLLGQTGIA
jgi:hypothetical protein